MNVRYWPVWPLATLAAIAIAWVYYVEERARTANPLEPWFNSEDNDPWFDTQLWHDTHNVPHLQHLPHPWSVTPPEWRRHT